MDLDQKIARSLHILHLMEKAVHGRVNWLIRIDGWYATPTVLVGENDVTFRAILPAFEPGQMVLLADGEVALVREVPGQPEPAECSWSLGLGTIPLAA
jgi:hypothetical protein